MLYRKCERFKIWLAEMFCLMFTVYKFRRWRKAMDLAVPKVWYIVVKILIEIHFHWWQFYLKMYVMSWNISINNFNKQDMSYYLKSNGMPQPFFYPPKYLTIFFIQLGALKCKWKRSLGNLRTEICHYFESWLIIG